MNRGDTSHGGNRDRSLRAARGQDARGGKAAFEASAPLYQGVQGLIRKYYLLSEDGRTGGGVYLFESREDAERLYDAAWRAGIRARLGAEPSIEYFESPVIVDNEVGAISSAA